MDLFKIKHKYNLLNTTVTARLLDNGDLRSVHRYERGKEIMREAVGLLEKPAKIPPLARKSESKTIQETFLNFLR